jgi:hypothetical protein
MNKTSCCRFLRSSKLYSKGIKPMELKQAIVTAADILPKGIVTVDKNTVSARTPALVLTITSEKADVPHSVHVSQSTTKALSLMPDEVTFEFGKQRCTVRGSVGKVAFGYGETPCDVPFVNEPTPNTIQIEEGSMRLLADVARCVNTSELVHAARRGVSLLTFKGRWLAVATDGVLLRAVPIGTTDGDCDGVTISAHCANVIAENFTNPTLAFGHNGLRAIEGDTSLFAVTINEQPHEKSVRAAYEGYIRLLEVLFEGLKTPNLVLDASDVSRLISVAEIAKIGSDDVSFEAGNARVTIKSSCQRGESDLLLPCDVAVPFSQNVSAGLLIDALQTIKSKGGKVVVDDSRVICGHALDTHNLAVLAVRRRERDGGSNA